MRRSIILAVIVAIVMIWADKLLAEDHGFLFGTVTTDDGEEYTGRIRWDKNEGFWDDVIDATKYDDERYDSVRRTSKRIRIFGFNINTGDNWSLSSSAQIQFGNIAAIEPRSRGRATLSLKNGEKIRFEDASSDLGPGIRGIQVDVEDEGLIDLDWSDLERVEFSPEPDSYKPGDLDVERLYGRVTTEGGADFTGYICWDSDEIYSSDVLDGNEKGRDRAIRLGTIEVIEKVSSSSSSVKLKSGREMKLSETNDVDSGNRGILVILPGIGQVKVSWDEFRSVTFLAPPSGSQMTYDRFDGGKELRGTVTDEDGEEHKGRIIWDDDERYTWEFLNGEEDNLEYDVAFAQIASIQRGSGRSATVVLRNGKELNLRGSNDVNDENKGIFVDTDDGDLVELAWDEFDKVAFEP
jgi:hypothetical protein